MTSDEKSITLNSEEKSKMELDFTISGACSPSIDNFKSKQNSTIKQVNSLLESHPYDADG